MTLDTLDPQFARTLPSTPAREYLAHGSLLGGRFQVLKLAGVGGMGEVYKAWDTVLERSVALKAVHTPDDDPPGQIGRFRQEAQTLAQLNHPGICQAYDLVSTEIGHFLAMEWVEGRTLDEATRKMSSKEKVGVLLETAEALAAAHLKGMVHRDLKPLNVMIDAEGHVKILDFGLARFIAKNEDAPVSQTERLFRGGCTSAGLPLKDGELPTGFYTALAEKMSSHSEHITRLGFFMGSPRYASPEQIRGELAGVPSDIFSFGVLMWELLLEEHPFPGEGKARLLAVVGDQRRALHGRLHRKLGRLLEEMLSPRPGDRPSALQVAKVLDSLLHPRTVIRWVIVTASTTLVASSLAYFAMARGVVADLTRERPARIAILPTVNHTGDPALTARLKWGVPEILGSSLRNSSKLAIVPPEALQKAVSEIQLSPDKSLGTEDIARLATHLGAELYLISEMTRNADGQGMIFNYRLVDKHGKVRLKDSETESLSEPAMYQTMPRDASTKLIHAMDPMGRNRNQALPYVLPPEVLSAYSEGMEFMNQGRFKEAEGPLRQAATVAPWFSTAVVKLGLCLYRKGDPSSDMAIQWGRWAARASGSPGDELSAMINIGLLLCEKGHWEDSRSVLEEALVLAKGMGAQDQEATILSDLALVFMETHKPEEAELNLHKALALDRQMGSRMAEAQTLNNLALLAKERGDFETARQNYQTVLEVSRQLGDRWTESSAHNNLGDVAIAQGHFDEAEGMFRESLRLKRATGSKVGEIIPLVNLGIVARIQKNWASSADYLHEALEISRTSRRPPLEAAVLFQLAELHQSQGSLNKARCHYQEASRIHRELGDATALAQDLAGEAECTDVSKAKALLNEASIKEIENPFILRSQAHAFLMERRIAEAREYMNRAITSARKKAPEEIPGLRERLGLIR